MKFIGRGTDRSAGRRRRQRRGQLSPREVHRQGRPRWRRWRLGRQHLCRRRPQHQHAGGLPLRAHAPRQKRRVRPRCGLLRQGRGRCHSAHAGGHGNYRHQHRRADRRPARRTAKRRCWPRAARAASATCTSSPAPTAHRASAHRAKKANAAICDWNSRCWPTSGLLGMPNAGKIHLHPRRICRAPEGGRLSLHHAAAQSGRGARRRRTELRHRRHSRPDRRRRRRRRAGPPVPAPPRSAPACCCISSILVPPDAERRSGTRRPGDRRGARANTTSRCTTSRAGWC